MPRPPASDDDAALRWDDLDDPSHSDPSLAALEPDAGDEPDDSRDGKTDNGEGDAHPEPAPEGARRSAGVTLLTVLFGVVYVAWSAGWIIGVGLVPISGPTLAIEIMYQFSEFLAIVASALWFGAVVALTRDGRAAHRFGWLALGTLVLMPWPFVLGFGS